MFTRGKHIKFEKQNVALDYSCLLSNYCKYLDVLPRIQAIREKKWQLRIASVELISKESKVTLFFSDFIRTQSKLSLNEWIWKEDQLTLFLRIKILKILWQKKKKNACCPTPTKHLHINFLLTTKVRVSSKVPMSTAVENAASATSKLVLQEALLRTEKDKF